MFFHKKRGLTMPNRARKKIRIGISKLMPSPRITDRKAGVFLDSHHGVELVAEAKDEDLQCSRQRTKK